MDTVSFLNNYSNLFIRFSWIMLLQSSLLILILLGIDVLLRRKVRAVFRYCLWMLVLVKLVLPVGLALPCSPAYYASSLLPEAKAVDSSPEMAVTNPVITPAGDSIPHQTVLKTPDESVAAAETTAIEPPTVSESAPIQQPPVSLSWQTFLSLGWLIAVLVMLGLLVQRVFFVNSLIRQSKPADENLLSQLKRCASKMSLRRQIDLRISPNATSPSVCGLIRPVILIPDTLTDQLNTGQMDAILMHELAHIKRGDLWVNLVQALLQIIYFYNPLLWVANAVIRRIREQAVDEMVLVAMDDRAEEYPQTLLNVSKLVWSKPMLSLRLIGVVESKSALTGRIKHILSRPFPKSAKIGLMGLAAVFITAAVLLPMAKGQPKFKLKDFEITINRSTGESSEDENVEYAEGSQLMRAYMEALLSADEDAIANITSTANESTQKLRLTFNEIDKLNTVLADSPYHPSCRRTLSSPNPQVSTKIGLFPGGRIKRIDGIEYYLMAVVKQVNNGPWQLKDARWYHPDESFMETLETLHKEMAVSFVALAERFKPEKASSLDISEVEEELNQLGEETLEALESIGNNDYSGPVLYGHKVTVAKEDVTAVVASFAESLRSGSSNQKELYCPSSLINKLERLPGICNLENMQVEQIYSNDSFAIVLTDGVKRHDGLPYQLGFTFVVYPGGKWVFNDTDWISRETRNNFINGFRKNYPNVECVLNESELTSEQSNSYTATLPNGVTVELAGVCEYPSENNQWRKPNGGLLDRPYKKLNTTYVEPDYRLYELLFRVSGQHEMCTQVELNNSLKGHFGISPLNKKADGIELSDSDNCYSAVVSCDQEANTCDIEIGLWTEDWQTKASSAGDEMVIGDDREYAFSKPTSRPDGSLGIILSHDPPEGKLDQRLVAVDNDGNVHKSSFEKRTSTATLEQYQVEFKDIALDDIKEFRFQTRPFNWLTFKNVSLRPGGEREGKIESLSEGRSPNDLRLESWKVFLGDRHPQWVSGRLTDENEMNPDNLITVRCVDKQNIGIPYCRITFVERDNKETKRLIDFIPTDNRGYAFCDAINGSFSICAQLFGYSSSMDAWWYQYKKVESSYVAKEKPTIIVEWDSFPEGDKRIRGNVKDQYGRPLKEFDLVLTWREGDLEGWGEMHERQIKKHFIDSEGRFEIKNLPAGTYTYYVYPKEQDAYQWDFDMGEVTVAEQGNATQLNIEIEANTISLRPGGEREGEVETSTVQSDQIDPQWIISSPKGTSITMKEIEQAEGSLFYKHFTKQYLLELVSKCLDQEVTETATGESSGHGSSPSEVHKRIGFGIAFPDNDAERFKKIVAFKRQWNKLIQQEVYETFGVYMSGSGEQLIYRTDDRVGTIILYLSPDESDEDILQIKVMIQEVITPGGPLIPQNDEQNISLRPGGEREGELDEKAIIGDYVFSQDSKYSGKPVKILTEVDNLFIEMEGHKMALKSESGSLRFTTGDMVWNEDRTAKVLEWFLIAYDNERKQYYMGSPGNVQWRQYLIRKNKKIELKTISFRPGEETEGTEIVCLADVPGNWTFIDLQKAQTFDAPREPLTNQEQMLSWASSKGIDFSVRVKGDFCYIGHFDTFTWQVPNESWDSITPEQIKNNSDLANGELGYGNITRKRADLPRTYLFKTQQGDLGILQITEFIEDPKGVKIRYKLMQNDISLRPGGETEGENVPETLNPTPVKVNDPKYVSRITHTRPDSNKIADAFNNDPLKFEERVTFAVKDCKDGVVHCIDFDTERIIQVPSNVDIQNKGAVHLWCEKEGVDAIIQPNRLTTVKMASFPANDKQWSKIDKATFSKINSTELSSGKDLYSGGDQYMYHAFKSSSGRVGVVGLLFQNNAGSDSRLVLTYKLVKNNNNVSLRPGGEKKVKENSQFESYFPEDQEAGKELTKWWNNRSNQHPDNDAFFDLFRKGLRTCTIKFRGNSPMQYLGGNYIWHKQPNDPRAIDIVYHASFSPEFKYYSVYSGLSVANPKSERVLRRLVDIAMEPHQLGRICWGVNKSNQKEEFIALLNPYLKSPDGEIRERAEIVEKALNGEIDGGKWEREYHQKQEAQKTVEQFGDDLPRIKKKLFTGTSNERLDALEFIKRNNVTLYQDETFIAALGESAKDENADVRANTALLLGSNFIWGKTTHPDEVVDILLQLAKDEDREVRIKTVYYGLSNLTNMREDVVKQLVEMALDPTNDFSRIRWGLARYTDKEMVKKQIKPHLNLKGEKGELARHLYREIFNEDPVSAVQSEDESTALRPGGEREGEIETQSSVSSPQSSGKKSEEDKQTVAIHWKEFVKETEGETYFVDFDKRIITSQVYGVDLNNDESIQKWVRDNGYDALVQFGDHPQLIGYDTVYLLVSSDEWEGFPESS